MKHNHATNLKSHATLLNQICKLIPAYLVPKLARQHRVASRRFTPWSQVVAMLYAQLGHLVSLNDLCDSFLWRHGALHALRGATAPHRNTLSHANRTRDCVLAQQLYWHTLAHLQRLSPHWGVGGKLKRFTSPVVAIDSTTIPLIANCMDWAQHRRRKAAAKCHLSLNLKSFLPQFLITDQARTQDNRQAAALTGALPAGAVVIADRGYQDFKLLTLWSQRGLRWVVRAKDGFRYRVLKHLRRPQGELVTDAWIKLTGTQAAANHPAPLRLVVVRITVDGREQELRLLTNQESWSAATVAGLYRQRWDIELFFKQLKQNLQLVDFLGHNANAVTWQLWTAMLAHLLLRYLAWQSQWPHAFGRLVTLVRAHLWRRLDLAVLLANCGTAAPPPHFAAAPQQAYFAL
jgi:hypothetical protein